jgi:hypothetical protein
MSQSLEQPMVKVPDVRSGQGVSIDRSNGRIALCNA